MSNARDPTLSSVSVSEWRDDDDKTCQLRVFSSNNSAKCVLIPQEYAWPTKLVCCSFCACASSVHCAAAHPSQLRRRRFFNSISSCVHDSIWRKLGVNIYVTKPNKWIKNRNNLISQIKSHHIGLSNCILLTTQVDYSNINMGTIFHRNSSINSYSL